MFPPLFASGLGGQLEDDIVQLEKQLRVSEDERDRVLEEMHSAEDSLLTADEKATKVASPDVLTCFSPVFLPLSFCTSPSSHHCVACCTPFPSLSPQSPSPHTPPLPGS